MVYLCLHTVSGFIKFATDLLEHLTFALHHLLLAASVPVANFGAAEGCSRFKGLLIDTRPRYTTVGFEGRKYSLRKVELLCWCSTKNS
jgi:hypothetical protein